MGPPPPFPAGRLPRNETLTLRPTEAQYLRDRVAQSCRGSLLSHLFLEANEPGGDFPWKHPKLGTFRDDHRLTLRHARLFSQASHGASLVYNLLLAEADDRLKLIEKYRTALDDWRARAPLRELDHWDLGSLWPLVRDQGHRITPAARRFVEAWRDRVVEVKGRVSDDTPARGLVRKRESWTKGPRARLQNHLLLKDWGGQSAADPFSYRWSEVKTFIRDLRTGLDQA